MPTAPSVAPAVRIRIAGGWRNLVGSSIGLKTLMAVTGLGLVLFVILHMLGNLQVFAGPEQLNAYAKKLQNLGPFLWILRAGLLALFGLHVWAAAKVTRMSRAARRTPYLSAEPQVTTLAARTMLLSGLVVLAFIVFHLLHFTFGVTHPSHFHHRTPEGLHDVYAMVVLGFREWPVTLAYVVAQVLLALHIGHGASSAFQTLGVRHPRLQFLRGGFGPAVAALVFVGNVVGPLAILAGWVGLEGGR